MKKAAHLVPVAALVTFLPCTQREERWLWRRFYLVKAPRQNYCVDVVSILHMKNHTAEAVKNDALYKPANLQFFSRKNETIGGHIKTKLE